MSTTTAIVTIDIQLDYFPGGRFPLFRAKAAARKAALILAAGRSSRASSIMRPYRTPDGQAVRNRGRPGTARCAPGRKA